MIGFYRMSLTGSSHLAKEIVCQDANAVKTLSNKWVIAVIADGLGSAKYSDIGALLAVNSVIEFIEMYAPDKWHDDSLISLIKTAFHHSLKLIKKQSEKDEHEIKEYDTTLTALIYNGTNVVFGHVGDGGIVALSPYGDFSVLTKALKGDEHNVVVPLRHGPDNWIFGSSKESVCALAMMTDGIYDIACPWLLAKRDPPVDINYIRPFIDRNLLNVNTQEDFDNSQEEVKSFFLGKESENITDDKTFVAIINTSVMPEVKEDSYYEEPAWQELRDANNEKLYQKPPPPPPLPDNKQGPKSPMPPPPRPPFSPMPDTIPYTRKPHEKVDILAKVLKYLIVFMCLSILGVITFVIIHQCSKSDELMEDVSKNQEISTDNPVPEIIVIQNISFRENQHTLTVGAELQTEFDLFPNNTNYAQINVELDDSTIIEITHKENIISIKALKPGTAIITVSSKSNEVILARCTVTVNPATSTVRRPVSANIQQPTMVEVPPINSDDNSQKKPGDELN